MFGQLLSQRQRWIDGSPTPRTQLAVSVLRQRIRSGP